jgi:hypothetical protein
MLVSNPIKYSLKFLLSRPTSNEMKGILLLDPTITEGFPLWKGYRNWEPTPSRFSSTYPSGPPNTSLFEEVIYWTMKPYFPSPNPPNNTPETPIIPIQPFLHIVCAEWLTMITYLTTRLGQLEWEISFPKDFRLEEAADSSLRKLHVWRRLVPLYREMLTEILERAFRFPPNAPHQRYTLPPDISIPGLPNSVGILSSTQKFSTCSSCSLPTYPLSSLATPSVAFHALRPSFVRALLQMNELQQRLERLTTIATAAISIAESRLSFVENRNVSRLTWLATVFIPLTFITGLFSIQPDIPALKTSFGYYFAAAIPLALITLGVAAVIKWWRVVWEMFGGKKVKTKRRAEGFRFYKQESGKGKVKT